MRKIIIVCLVITMVITDSYGQSCTFSPGQCGPRMGILNNNSFDVANPDGGNEFAIGCVCEWDSYEGYTTQGELIGINSYPDWTGQWNAANLIVDKYGTNNYGRKDAIITRIPERDVIHDPDHLYYCNLLIQDYCPPNIGFKVYLFVPDAIPAVIEEMFTIDNYTTTTGYGGYMFHNNYDEYYSISNNLSSLINGLPQFIIITPIITDPYGSAEIEMDFVDMGFFSPCYYNISLCPQTCNSGMLLNGDFQVGTNYISSFEFGGEVDYGCVCGWETFSGICSIESDRSNNYAVMALTNDKISPFVTVDPNVDYTLSFDFKFDDYNGGSLSTGQDIIVQFVSTTSGTLYGNFVFDLNGTYAENLWHSGQIDNISTTISNIDGIVIYPGNSNDLTTGFELSIDNVMLEETSKLKPSVLINVDNSHCPGEVSFNYYLGGSPVKPTTCTWDFGDGSDPIVDFYSQGNQNITHTFTNSGVTKLNRTVKLTLTYSDGCSEQETIVISIYPNPVFVAIPPTEIQGTPIKFKSSVALAVENYTYDFGDGQEVTASTELPLEVFHTYNNDGDYFVTLTVDYTGGPIACTYTTEVSICHSGCIKPFSPFPDKEYVFSVWVKQNIETPIAYSDPEVTLDFTLFDSENQATIGPYYPTGPVIDGWQRIYFEFEIPATAIDISINMANNSQSDNCFFDDIRLHPSSGNMKSFVYDPVSLRFLAELDENNYATFYDYDEEGKLIRVKKETEKGIVTLNESRNHTIKQ